ncbi:MAG: prephenate dehydrogenase/arogenate dehydrogenase family protein [Candidatus Eremiobacteraeota bacterium]|nr:prephenate dehydrogenase/arogenate dehydrogenase family protein [Candidatus Eremiobacteraeota bacterium]
MKRRKKLSQLLIVGTGLIGTSAGLALRSRSQLAITGWDRSRRNAHAARRRGALDAVASRLGPAVARADIVLLAAPIDAIVAMLPRVIDAAKSGALVLDVGPLFAPVVAAARPALAKHTAVNFVAGHPLAGRESSGPAHADATLFRGSTFALFAPPQAGRAAAWRRAEVFVRLLGARPARVDPATHDRAIAATSALPQLAAIALALAAGRSLPKGGRMLSGPGFEGATRLARSSFSIWRRALSGNARNAAGALRALEKAARTLRTALESGNIEKIGADFRAAAAARRRILAASGRTSATRTS